MKKILNKILPELIALRHQIHAHPELAHEEHMTANLIYKMLTKFGYHPQYVSKTGVVTTLDSGKPGKTVALRADIDALPIQECTALSYQSLHPGKMHACGHDGHAVTLLAVAGLLAQYTTNFKGKIKFIFQPAEETGTGAASLIKAGVLDNPKVDAIFGYHNTPKSDLGVFRTKKDCIHAAQEVFTVSIKGKAAHAAQPQLAIDPIYIGSLMIQAIQSIVSRLNAPFEPIVLSVTQFHAGTTHNIIPEQAVFNGTIRTITVEARQKVKQQLEEMVISIASTFHATAKIDFSYCFPPTINSDFETEFALQTAQKILVKEKTALLTSPSMASEDFSYYLEQVPGCFFWIGMGLQHLNMHNPSYQFNDDIIPIAAEVLAQIAINYLNR